MTETSVELTKKLAAAVEKMPAFPKSVQRILEITRDINCEAKEIVMVIEKDPVMTMKLLRILNSAYYSFPQQITSVNQSVIYLGINTVKNMALAFAAAGVLPKHNDAGFDMQRYLMHSLTTASLARALCQRYATDDTDPTDCYIAGLLHDFGKVVYAQFMAEEFKKALSMSMIKAIPLHMAEREVIGEDHSVAGAMLVEKWKFPKPLIDSIRFHHADIPPENMQRGCLFIADQISKKLIAGTTDDFSKVWLPAALVARFGTVQEIVARLGDISKILDEAVAFTRSSQEAAA